MNDSKNPAPNPRGNFTDRPDNAVPAPSEPKKFDIPTYPQTSRQTVQRLRK
jgi:hypothetical protein